MWGWCSKLLQREGAEPDVSDFFIVLFGAETWALSSRMAQSLEGVHVGFLKQVTKLKSKRLR